QAAWPRNPRRHCTPLNPGNDRGVGCHLRRAAIQSRRGERCQRGVPHQQQRLPSTGDDTGWSARGRWHCGGGHPRVAKAHGWLCFGWTCMTTGAHGVPRAILFDWDNTLVDNWAVINDSMNAVFSAFGMPQWTLAETKARTRASLRDSFPRMFGE